jgi:predicted DNA-binding transcriptional regulator AlpA
MNYQERADRFLMLRDVVELTGLSASTLRRLERTAEFPPHRKVSRRRIVWSAADVFHWMALRTPTPSSSGETRSAPQTHPAAR